MRAAFAIPLLDGLKLAGWLSAGKCLSLDAEFKLFGQRADLTDLDNLLSELFDQILLAPFPKLSPHERARKDRFFFDARIRKTKVWERTAECSVITITSRD